MSEITINGRNYAVPEMNFDAVCELEEKGINILNMGENMKIATMVRGLVAWIMKTDLKTASNEIQKHIQNGGNIMDIMDSFSAAVEDSGFFGRTQGKAVPMDHRRKRNHRNRRNGNRSQRS